jgi:hypothetical protein
MSTQTYILYKTDYPAIHFHITADSYAEAEAILAKAWHDGAHPTPDNGALIALIALAGKHKALADAALDLYNYMDLAWPSTYKRDDVQPLLDAVANALGGN